MGDIDRRLAIRKALILWSATKTKFREVKEMIAELEIVDFTPDEAADLKLIQEASDRLLQGFYAAKAERKAAYQADLARILQARQDAQAAKLPRVSESSVPVPASAAIACQQGLLNQPAAASSVSSTEPSQQQNPVGAASQASSSAGSNAVSGSKVSAQPPAVPARVTAADRARTNPSIPVHALLRGVAMAPTAATKPLPQTFPAEAQPAAPAAVSDRALPAPPVQSVASAVDTATSDSRKRPHSEVANAPQDVLLTEKNARSITDSTGADKSGTAVKPAQTSDANRTTSMAPPVGQRSAVATVAVTPEEAVFYRAGMAIRAHPRLITVFSFETTPEALAAEEPTLLEPFLECFPAGHAWTRSTQELQDTLGESEAAILAKLRHQFAATVLQSHNEAPKVPVMHFVGGAEKSANIDARILSEYQKCCLANEQWEPYCADVADWAFLKEEGITKRLDRLLMAVAARVPKIHSGAAELAQAHKEVKMELILPPAVSKGDDEPFDAAEEEHLLAGHQICCAKNQFWNYPQMHYRSFSQGVARRMKRSDAVICKKLKELIRAAQDEVQIAAERPRASDPFSAAEELLILDAHQQWLWAHSPSGPRYLEIATFLGRTERSVKLKAAELRKRVAYNGVSAGTVAATRTVATSGASAQVVVAPTPAQARVESSAGNHANPALRVSGPDSGRSARAPSAVRSPPAVLAAEKSAGWSDVEDDDMSLLSFATGK